VKYTPLIPFVSMFIPFLFLIVVKRSVFKKIVNKRNVMLGLLLSVIFGGYWYIKNVYLYSNPVFPFFFECRPPYDAQCSTGASFFGSWTTKVNLQTLFPVLKELLRNNIPLIILSLLLPFIAFLNKDKKTQKITIMLGALVVIETVLLSKFSGFHFRYNQHLQFILILLISVQITNKYSSAYTERITKIVFVLTAIVLIPYYFYSVYYNYLNASFRQETSYALGRASIYQWIEWRMPKMTEFVRWCDNQKEPVRVVRHDPDMIWYGYEGLVRVFLTNCYFDRIPIHNKSLAETEELIRNEDLKFYLASLNDCVTEDKIEVKSEHESPERLLMRKRNNMMVCTGEEIVESLYFIDM